jgi:hypothetical protein
MTGLFDGESTRNSARNEPRRPEEGPRLRYPGEADAKVLERRERVDEEVERRTVKPGNLSLDQVLAAFTRDMDRHTTGGPASDSDLKRLEGLIGHRLPPSFRAFLMHLGGGLFFHGHEIFGAQRVMIHDIELVPGIVSVRDWLARNRGLPEGLIPFHRARGAIHVLDARSNDGNERVSRLDGPGEYPDLATFLETVVLPRRPAL